MKYETYAHRYVDIILNSDYALKQEMEEVVQFISFESILYEFEQVGNKVLTLDREGEWFKAIK